MPRIKTNVRTPAGFNDNAALIERICETLTMDEMDETDRPGFAFVAVLDEIERLAEAQDLIGIKDLCATLKIGMYQRTRACETASYQFAEVAHGEIQRLDG